MTKRTKQAIPETGRCALCGGTYSHYGNNPEPILPYEKRVCDMCNATKVIPFRLAKVGETIVTKASEELKKEERQ